MECSDPTTPPEPQTIKEWQKTVLALAKEKGFHATTDPLDNIWKMLGNLHGEVSEAWEVARMPDFDPKVTWKNENGKLEGFPSELADIVIRALDTAEIFGIDLQAAMWEKHQYNMTRPYRHGNKRA